MLNIDNSRSYATEANLLKAIKKLRVDKGYVVVKNRQGRWTAIFSYHVHGVRPVHYGFMTIN
jgi:hypothetical protein